MKRRGFLRIFAGGVVALAVNPAMPRLESHAQDCFDIYAKILPDLRAWYREHHNRMWRDWMLSKYTENLIL